MSPAPDTLADPQQVIADLQRELSDAQERLAERTAERDEALEQQTATAEVLQVINSSPGDLVPVFDAILDKGTRLCDAAFGTLRTYDGESFNLAASRGASPALLEFQRKPLSSGLGIRRFLQGESVRNVPDIIEGEAYRAGSPAQRALVELGGARSFLSVALRREGALLGYMSFYWREVRPFTDKQVVLLQNFAAQAVIAMENARLLGELRKRTDEVAELRRSSKAIVARSSSCSAICAATPPSPRPPSPRKSSNSFANTMVHWDRSSPNSKGRSTNFPATGSWCFSMILYRSRTRQNARSRWG